MFKYRFNDYIAFNKAANKVSKNAEVVADLVECFSQIMKFAKNNSFTIKEAAGDRKRISQVPRRLKDAEHEVLSQRLGANWPDYRDEQLKKANKAKPGADRKSVMTNAYPTANKNIGADVAGNLKSVFMDQWPVIKAALKAAGVNDPDSLLSMSPQDRQDTISNIDWTNVAVSDIKQQLKSSNLPIIPDEEYKRQYGIAKLKKVRDLAQIGREPNDPQLKQLYQQYTALVQKLNSDPNTKIVGKSQPDRGLEFPVMGAEPSAQDVQSVQRAANDPANAGKLKGSYDDDSIRKTLRHGPEDYDKFLSHRISFGNFIQEAAASDVNLHPDHVYDLLTKQGVEIISDEEAEDTYLTSILGDLASGHAFLPTTKERTWRAAAEKNIGRSAASTGIHHPKDSPAFIQKTTGIMQGVDIGPAGKKLRPKGYLPHEQLPSDSPKDLDDFFVNMERKGIAKPSPEINQYYKDNTADFEEEMMKPARIVAKKYFFNPSDVEEAAQEIAMNMMQHTGLENWRDSEALRMQDAKIHAIRLGFTVQPTRAAEIHLGPKTNNSYDDERVSSMDRYDKETNNIDRGEKLDKVSTQDRDSARNTFTRSLDDIDTTDMPQADAEWVKDIRNNLTQAAKDGDRKAMLDAFNDLKDLASEYPAIQDALDGILAKVSDLDLSNA